MTAKRLLLLRTSSTMTRGNNRYDLPAGTENLPLALFPPSLADHDIHQAIKKTCNDLQVRALCLTAPIPGGKAAAKIYVRDEFNPVFGARFRHHLARVRRQLQAAGKGNRPRSCTWPERHPDLMDEIKEECA